MPPDAGPDGDHPAPAAPGSTRWELPFWALQVLELGVAFLLVTQSVHVRHGGVLVGAGAVLAVLALTADGPLGIVVLHGRRLHRVLLVVVVTALVVSAAAPALRTDVEGLLVIGLAVVALVFFASRTSVAGGGRARRGRRAGPRGPVIDATATVVDPADPTDATTSASPDDADTSLRRAGRTTGAAAAAGRRAVDDHRPQVEEQVKRGLRGAGRLAGKLAGPKASPTAGTAPAPAASPAPTGADAPPTTPPVAPPTGA